MREPGIIISIMVDDAAASVDKLTAAGAKIVRSIDPDASEIIAWFRDPGGHALGIYQEPSMSAT
jgi:predicted enzyme related to lactoylglutathione lyase